MNRYFALLLTRNERFARKTKERITNPDCRREGKEKGGIEERGKGERGICTVVERERRKEGYIGDVERRK